MVSEVKTGMCFFFLYFCFFPLFAEFLRDEILNVLEIDDIVNEIEGEQIEVSDDNGNFIDSVLVNG